MCRLSPAKNNMGLSSLLWGSTWHSFGSDKENNSFTSALDLFKEHTTEKTVIVEH